MTGLVPNRIAAPLDQVERLAESGDLRRRREAAWATGNRALVAVLDEFERMHGRRKPKLIPSSCSNDGETPF